MGSPGSFSYIPPLIAGGVAGLSVDMALYPIDTVKTRLQSEKGFYKSGGFRGIYNGLSSVIVGSMPTSALFFVSYEFVKANGSPLVPAAYVPVVHMLAASFGEVTACLVRVPTEIVKQRKQTKSDLSRRGGIAILVQAYREHGLAYGLYRGYFSTVMRDMPFSLIQMPVWELLKSLFRDSEGNITSFQGACCGSLAGAISGAITTPLDVVKTRIVLSEEMDPKKLKMLTVLSSVYCEGGIKGVFAGLVPRVVAFTIGGFVFLGAYEYVKEVLTVL